MTARETAKLAAAQRRAEKEQRALQAKEMLVTGLRELIDNHPLVETIEWDQSSSHYNDEYTAFRAFTSSARINDEDGWDLRYAYQREGAEKCPLGLAAKELEDLLETFEQGDFKRFFGGDVTIVVTREGITFKSYTETY